MTGQVLAQPSALELRWPDGHWRPINPAGIVIGRDTMCDIVLDRPDISRQHARIAQVQGVWRVEDLGSTNGVYLNGQRVPSVAVAGDTRIVLGPGAQAPVMDLRLRANQEQVQRDRVAEVSDAAFESQAKRAGTSLLHGTRVVWTATVGRMNDNAVVLNDPLVSRHHTRIMCVEAEGQRQLYVADLGSANGTFVAGNPIRTLTPIAPGTEVAIGSNRLTVFLDGVRQRPPDEIVLQSVGATVVTADGVPRLRGIDLVVRRGELVAVVGPSGAGKSTLLGVLTGTRELTHGLVMIAGRSLHAEYAELSQQMGYVPQDDIVHPQLTTRQELNYAAQLRTAPDISPDERTFIVNDVIARLGLVEAADRPINKLSGGQRKRVNVALELLTRPPIMFLDEPTSGLDPGHDKSLMRQLRELADGGRAIVVVTHNTTYLDLCDRVLVLAPGGSLAYLGSPRETLKAFNAQDFAEVFEALERDPTAGRRGQPDAASQALPQQGARFASLPPSAATRHRWSQRFSVLSRRYMKIISADGRNLLLLTLQAPILGLLIRAIGKSDGLALPTGTHASARGVLFTLVLSATWLGASNSVREIVKERPIYERERLIGVPVGAYLWSKIVPLGVLTFVQTLVLLLISLGGRKMPDGGALFGSAGFELVITLWLSGMTALALGLMISAMVSKADKAMTLLPLLLIPQMVLCGGVLNLNDTPALKPISYVVSARWGFAAAAATVDLKKVEVTAAANAADTAGTDPDTDLNVANVSKNDNDPLWKHKGGVWFVDIMILAMMSALFVLLAWWALGRSGIQRR